MALKAQAIQEIWQVVLSIPAMPGSGLSGVIFPPNPTLIPNEPGLNFPFGITADSSGNILVADSFNNLIRRFDSSGNENLVIGSVSGGTQPNRFYSPQDVAVDASGDIVVTDTGNNRVSVFDTSGNPLFRVGTYTNPVTGGSESFGWPWGIAFSPGTAAGRPGSCPAGGTGRIAVVNSYVQSSPIAGTTGDVAVFDSCFNPLFMLGMPTAGAAADSVLSAPIAVDIDPTTGDYLVTDAGSNPRVVVYGATGQYLFSFGSGSLSGPDAIATDPAGRIVVADAYDQVVDFYSVDFANATATLQFSISQSNTPGTFLFPHGLAFTPGGQLLVTTGTSYSTPPYGANPSTQYILEFDRPSLAIHGVSVTSGGTAVTGAVPPGTALDFTVTVGAANGQVDSTATTGSVTLTDDSSGTPVTSTVSLTPSIPLSATSLTAGSTATVTYSYTVPSTVTQATVAFTAGATGVVNNGVMNAVTAPPFTPTSVSVSASDTTPPTITLTTSPAAPQSNGWYNTNVTLTLTATDNAGGSGVKEIDYYFTGAQQGVDPTHHIVPGSTATTVITQDKSSTIWYWAVDNAGNTSLPTPASATFQVDETAPYVIFSAPSPLPSPLSSSVKWWNSTVSVPFRVLDESSGVQSYSPGSPLAFSTEGANQTQVVTATDKAGNSTTSATNQGPFTSPVINIDLHAPVITSITQSPAANVHGWNNTPVTVTYKATDNLSGFQAADALNGVAGQLQGERIITLNSEGRNQSPPAQTFTDLAGNVSTPGVYPSPINIDRTPPTVQVTVQPTQATPPYVDTSATPNRTWYNAPVNVTFAATDALSGFANGTGMALATVPVGNGIDQTVTRSFTDLAGNTAAGSAGPISVDTVPPVLTRNVSRTGGTETVGFAAVDSGSGIASCTISVNNAVVQQTCGPMIFSTIDAGKVVTATAVDEVGNRSTSSVTISFAPPEAYNRFDPGTRDVLVYGFDPTTGASLGVIPAATVTRTDSTGVLCEDPRGGRWFGPFPAEWWGNHDPHVQVRAYEVTNAAGDTVTLVERVKRARRGIDVQVLGFQYTVDGVTGPLIIPPDSTTRFHWALNPDGSLKTLNQQMSIGGGRTRVMVQAGYSSRQDQTSIRLKATPPQTRLTRSGLVLLQMATHHDGGDLVIQASGMPAVSGPTTDADESSGQGDSHDNALGGGHSRGNGALPFSYAPDGGSNRNGSLNGNGSDQSHGNKPDGDHHHGDRHQSPTVAIEQGSTAGSWTATIGSGSGQVQVQATYDAARNQTTLTMTTPHGTQSFVRPGRVPPHSVVNPKTGKLTLYGGSDHGGGKPRQRS